MTIVLLYPFALEEEGSWWILTDFLYSKAECVDNANTHHNVRSYRLEKGPEALKALLSVNSVICSSTSHLHQIDQFPFWALRHDLILINHLIGVRSDSSVDLCPLAIYLLNCWDTFPCFGFFLSYANQFPWISGAKHYTDYFILQSMLWLNLKKKKPAKKNLF